MTILPNTQIGADGRRWPSGTQPVTDPRRYSNGRDSFEITGTSFTLSPANNTQFLYASAAGAKAVAIPRSAVGHLPVGFEAVIFAAGPGVLTLGTSGLTLLGAPVTQLNQGEAVFVKKTATDTWSILIMDVGSGGASPTLLGARERIPTGAPSTELYSPLVREVGDVATHGQQIWTTVSEWYGPFPAWWAFDIAAMAIEVRPPLPEAEPGDTASLSLYNATTDGGPGERVGAGPLVTIPVDTGGVKTAAVSVERSVLADYVYYVIEIGDDNVGGSSRFLAAVTTVHRPIVTAFAAGAARRNAFRTPGGDALPADASGWSINGTGMVSGQLHATNAHVPIIGLIPA
jgi:hypothetical protein